MVSVERHYSIIMIQVTMVCIEYVLQHRKFNIRLDWGLLYIYRACYAASRAPGLVWLGPWFKERDMQ